ncbi:TetR family transcriptional regulator (plasmid) [Mycolicibacterium psychrotolerans]|uniref:TetR family transcriptional regulator n=1 Tax=Mycolicibacterium psychrotolerans TaxID=216929 RepID=UPI003D664571
MRVTGAPAEHAAAIRAARIAAGLSVRKLASLINVSAATISAIENARTGVNVTRLVEIAAALHISPSQLLGGDSNLPARKPDANSPVTTGQFGADWRQFPALNLDPVLAGAIRCFVETGYHGTTMRTLAASIGVSVPTIYHHYADKQQLLTRILDIGLSDLQWRIDAARSQATTSVGEVALIVEVLTLFHIHRRDIAFIGASEMRGLERANRPRITGTRDQLQHALDDAIDRAIEDGSASHRQPRVAGRAIATMCTSLPQWYRLGGPTPPDQLAKSYVEFAFSMLGVTDGAAALIV